MSDDGKVCILPTRLDFENRNLSGKARKVRRIRSSPSFDILKIILVCGSIPSLLRVEII